MNYDYIRITLNDIVPKLCSFSFESTGAIIITPVGAHPQGDESFYLPAQHAAPLRAFLNGEYSVEPNNNGILDLITPWLARTKASALGEGALMLDAGAPPPTPRTQRGFAPDPRWAFGSMEGGSSIPAPESAPWEPDAPPSINFDAINKRIAERKL